MTKNMHPKFLLKARQARKEKLFSPLRSVGDDATSYKGNHLDAVIVVLNRNLAGL
jgi:hypothetical protein